MNKERRIRVGLWIPDDKDLYDSLYSHKDEIEKAFARKLEWDRLEGKKASVLCTYVTGLNFNKQDNYPQLMNDAIDLVISLRAALTPFIK